MTIRKRHGRCWEGLNEEGEVVAVFSRKQYAIMFIEDQNKKEEPHE